VSGFDNDLAEQADLLADRQGTLLGPPSWHGARVVVQALNQRLHEMKMPRVCGKGKRKAASAPRRAAPHRHFTNQQSSIGGMAGASGGHCAQGNLARDA
jgi:hypothetical protein